MRKEISKAQGVIQEDNLIQAAGIIQEDSLIQEENLIQAEGVVRSFPVPGAEDFRALKGVDITIPRGRLTMLKGRSGSGKTTLLNILSALDLPNEGRVSFEGRIVNEMSEGEREELRRYQMGFVFQSVALIPIMSAYENVDFGLRLSGYPENHGERIREVLSLVGLEERMAHLPRQMSGGEQQRVAIARAIAHKPRIIFADEPTGALDTATGLAVVKLFRTLLEKQELTIVMSTHDPNLMELGDLVYEIEDGEIVGREEHFNPL